MKPIYKLFFLPVFLFLQGRIVAEAQSIKDSSLFISLVKISYSAQVPSADMAKRFGINSAVNLGFSIKTKNNFIYGIDGTFVFGNNIKEIDILDSLKASAGFIINQNGNPETVRLFERGYGLSAYIGKLFHVLAHNKNSGIVAYIGPAYFTHKIKIDDIGRQTAELTEPYKKGYDRLAGGFGLHEVVGYVYLSNNGLLNFFGGFDCLQAYTKNLRSYNFDLMKADTHNRWDILSGLRVGWILPLYKKTPQQYYYQ